MSKNSLGILPLLTAAAGAYSAYKGASGGSGSALPPTANPMAPGAPVGGSPAFQQSFTPQMSPNFIVGSTVSGDLRASTSQVAPGGQTAANGPDNTPGLPGQRPLAQQTPFNIRDYTEQEQQRERSFFETQDIAKIVLFTSIGLAALFFATKK